VFFGTTGDNALAARNGRSKAHATRAPAQGRETIGIQDEVAHERGPGSAKTAGCTRQSVLAAFGPAARWPGEVDAPLIHCFPYRFVSRSLILH